MSNFKFKWLDELSKKVKNLSGTYDANEMFDEKFMRNNTRFSSFNEMISYSWFEQDFKDIPEEEWNYFVKETTNFKNRDEMKGAGWKDLIKRKLAL